MRSVSLVFARALSGFNVLSAMSASVEERVTKYLELIPLMPRANQCLLLYILDILQVFARRSDENVMSLVGELSTRLVHLHQSTHN